MRVLWQIGLVLGICFAGEGLSLLLPFSFPASVISLLLLLFLLLSKRLDPRDLHQTSDFLLRNIAVFFIPSGVGIMQVFHDIRGSLLPLLAVCILSAVITFGATALTVRAVIRVQKWMRARICKGERV